MKMLTFFRLVPFSLQVVRSPRDSFVIKFALISILLSSLAERRFFGVLFVVASGPVREVARRHETGLGIFLLC